MLRAHIGEINKTSCSNYPYGMINRTHNIRAENSYVSIHTVIGLSILTYNMHCFGHSFNFNCLKEYLIMQYDENE